MPACAALPGGLTLEDYYALLRRAIVGEHDPANVILLEIDPDAAEDALRFPGDRAPVRRARGGCARGARRGKPRCSTSATAASIPIERIYNRAIVDELERRAIDMPFDFRDDLEVEWAGHPNWFFRLSKFSLPYL